MAEGAGSRNGAPLVPASEGIEWREIDGEITLLDTRESEYVGLNQAGSLLWLSITKGANRDHLVGVLVGRFSISNDQASADVDTFLDDLTRRGFLQP